MELRSSQQSSPEWVWNKLSISLATAFLLSVLFSLFITVSTVSYKVLDYKPMMVVSNSMVPYFEKGDLIIVNTREKTPKVGTVVVYHWDALGADVVHRVVSVRGDVVTVKGDNNSLADDPFPKEKIIGTVERVAPNLGWVYNSITILALGGVTLSSLLISFLYQRFLAGASMRDLLKKGARKMEDRIIPTPLGALLKNFKQGGVKKEGVRVSTAPKPQTPSTELLLNTLTQRIAEVQQAKKLVTETLPIKRLSLTQHFSEALHTTLREIKEGAPSEQFFELTIINLIIDASNDGYDVDEIRTLLLEIDDPNSSARGEMNDAVMEAKAVSDERSPLQRETGIRTSSMKGSITQKGLPKPQVKDKVIEEEGSGDKQSEAKDLLTNLQGAEDSEALKDAPTRTELDSTPITLISGSTRYYPPAL